MSCCLRDITVEDLVKKNARFVTKTVPATKHKEMKAFYNVCRGYKIGKEDDCLCKLCIERVRIYTNNDNTLERIRQYLVLCDSAIKAVEVNRLLLRKTRDRLHEDGSYDS